MENFEKDLKRLEEVSQILGSGEINLDEATKIFQEGMNLSKKLESQIEQTEQIIEVLVNNPSESDEAEFETFN